MYRLLSPIRRRSRGERGFFFFQGTKNLKTAWRKNGIVKIEHCRQAKVYGCQWVWVDTCCIDKVSSAELLEGHKFNVLVVLTLDAVLNTTNGSSLELLSPIAPRRLLR
jgi:hypothetical protein